MTRQAAQFLRMSTDRQKFSPIVSRAMIAKAQDRLASRRQFNHANAELIAGLKRILAEHGAVTKALIRAHACASVSVEA